MLKININVLQIFLLFQDSNNFLSFLLSFIFNLWSTRTFLFMIVLFEWCGSKFAIFQISFFILALNVSLSLQFYYLYILSKLFQHSKHFLFIFSVFNASSSSAVRGRIKRFPLFLRIRPYEGCKLDQMNICVKIVKIQNRWFCVLIMLDMLMKIHKVVDIF